MPCRLNKALKQLLFVGPFMLGNVLLRKGEAALFNDVKDVQEDGSIKVTAIRS